MKKLISFFVLVLFIASIFASCVDGQSNQPKSQAYFTFFDTISYIHSYANDTAEEFAANSNMVSNMLQEYHRLFDIYNEYEGINNLCTLNKNAGGEAVELDARLIDFLIYCKDIYDKTSGEVNVMAGAVLSLWHDERENVKNGGTAKLPDATALSEAAKHVNINTLILDTFNNTARIIDKDARIDVGAIGKGYAAEMCAKRLEQFGVSSYVLDIGGNLRIIGKKPDGTGWLTGITDPLGTDEFAARVTISDVSCVTSGDYERYYTVGNTRYHHIIDMDTLYPSEHFTSVTVITKNSALADALSTALFCMTYEEGIATLDTFEDDVQVLWIYKDGTQKSMEGFDSIRVN